MLARLFVAAAAAQIAVGLVLLVRGGRLATALTALINGAAVVVWAFTRVAGISVIDGLEHAEAPELIDTMCAMLGSLAASGASWALVRRRTAPAGRPAHPGSRRGWVRLMSDSRLSGAVALAYSSSVTSSKTTSAARTAARQDDSRPGGGSAERGLEFVHRSQRSILIGAPGVSASQL